MYNRIDMGVRIAGERALKNDEFITLGQLTAGNGIQIIRENGNVEIMSMGYDGVLQIENVQIDKQYWSNQNNIYEYRYYNEVITEDSVVTAIPSNAALGVVTDAQLLPTINTINNFIIIQAINLPSEAFNITFSVSGKLHIEQDNEDQYRCGETIGGHKVVFLHNNALFLADKDNNTCFGNVIGLSAQSGMYNEFISIKKENVLYLDGWNLITNSHYYLGNNGSIVNSKPSTGIIQYIGFAKNENELHINIQKPIRSII